MKEARLVVPVVVQTAERNCRCAGCRAQTFDILTFVPDPDFEASIQLCLGRISIPLPLSYTWTLSLRRRRRLPAEPAL